MKLSNEILSIIIAHASRNEVRYFGLAYTSDSEPDIDAANDRLVGSAMRNVHRKMNQIEARIKAGAGPSEINHFLDLAKIETELLAIRCEIPRIVSFKM